MDFKDRLRGIRNEKCVTVTQLAAHLNKGESAVRMWELGRSNPDFNTLIRLAQYFNCTTDYLLGFSESKNEKNKKEQEARIEELSYLLNGLIENDKNDFYFTFIYALQDYIKLMNIFNKDTAVANTYKGALSNFVVNVRDSIHDYLNYQPVDGTSKDFLINKIAKRDRDSCHIVSSVFFILENTAYSIPTTQKGSDDNAAITDQPTKEK